MTVYSELNDQLVAIPEGTIHLRDDRTNKKWITEVPAFSLAKTTVSQDEYSRVVGTTPSAYKCRNGPVENVSWLEAAKFCNLLSKNLGFTDRYQLTDNDAVEDQTSDGFRLPSEAEWDARGCLATNRRRGHPIFKIDDLGFRIARSAFKQ